ncbi:Eukaryotic translation initiation factor 2C, partial [Nowakowskiella sp. JEL0078]
MGPKARGRGRGGKSGGGGRPEQSYPAPVSEAPSTSSRPQTPLEKPPIQQIPQAGSSSSVYETASITGISSTSTVSSVREITQTLTTVSLNQGPKLPRRPQFGSKGTKIQLISNFYSLQFPDRSIYQYVSHVFVDVTITPEGPRPRPAMVNRRIFNFWRTLPVHKDKQKDVIRLAVYDGQKTFYCPGRLDLGDEGELKWDIELPEEDGSSSRIQSFKIKIQETTIVQMEKLHQYLSRKSNDALPRDCIAVMETLLRQRPTTIFANKNSKSGGSFFQLHDGTARPLGGGLCVQQGWYQAARPTIKQLLMLNLDVSATAFYKPGSLIDSLMDFYGVRNPRDIYMNVFNRHRAKFEKFLREVTITITYRSSGRKKYKIKGISSLGADKQLMKVPEEDTTTTGSPFFGHDIKKQVTVEKYYNQMFGKKLALPFLPVVLSGQFKQIHIPMEFCNVKENQRYIGKLNETQLANMIKITATPPDERFKKIETGRGALHNEIEQIAMLKNWGVIIDPKPVGLTGRVLDPPKMNGGSGGGGKGRGGGGGNPITIPRNGVWRLDSYFKPAELKHWSVLVVGNPRYYNEDRVYNFTYILSQQMSGKGMKIADWEPMIVVANNKNTRDALIEANKFSRKDGSGSPANRAEIIIVVLCEGAVYHDIKRVAEIELGVMTQCCLLKNVDKAAPAYCQNLALKINVKLGGVNNLLVPDALKDVKQVAPQMNQRVMIFGADVTHPSPGQQRDPNSISIAAMTATVDK